MTGQTHVAGGALFTAAGLGAATAAGWMHAPAWALAIGIPWGAIAGDLPDIDHPKARVSRSGVAFGLAGWLLGLAARIIGLFIRSLRVTHRGPTHSLAFMALWATIAAPLYLASAGGVLVALAWIIDKIAAATHTTVAPDRAVGNPVPARALGSHLPVRRGVHRAWIALAPRARLAHWSHPVGVAVRSSADLARALSALRIRTGSSLETCVVRPALTVAATLAFLEVAGIPLARQALALGLIGSALCDVKGTSESTLPEATSRLNPAV